MIGIVIVSHSARLAEGIVELARTMGGADVQIRAAGGLDMPGQPLGTDPLLILHAIEEVFSDEGVLVLMDLGSAILSAEMAVEMLPDGKREKVLLCAAPIVEGAVVAVVQARMGSSLQQVAAEARGALAAKQIQFNPSEPKAQPVPPDKGEFLAGESTAVIIKVRNALGLHARPAARLVKTAGQYTQAEISVKNLTTGKGPVSARSINAVTTLGVLQGHELRVSAAGPDAAAALKAIQRLADENFGDSEQPALPTVPASRAANLPKAAQGKTPLQGLPASPGIAIGLALVFQPVLPVIPTHLTDQPWDEWETLQRSIEKTRSQIAADLAAVNRLSAETLDILEAHLLFLDDEELLLPARNAIFDRKQNAAAAWQQTITSMADNYRQMTDAYLQSRAKDVEDVGRQVLVNLLGLEVSSPQLKAPAILIAPDLTPAETARLDPAMVLGICTARGGATSHTAILAASKGIPAVIGLGDDILSVTDGARLVMDGGTGVVWIDPPQEIVDDYSLRAAAARASKIQAQAESQSPAVTRDGHRVGIMANIGSIEGIRQALSYGAEGVGLFRTEFLFLDRQTAPGEEEQFDAYRAAAGALDGRPLVIRTLDAGGDKALPYLKMEAEANPFLGWRAIRICLARPDLFKTQLRAIMRVAIEFPVKVMFPMVATLEEWRAARALLQEASNELQQNGQSAPARIETGMMVEIPAAAIKAETFAREVDFFSIGTNDLTQYTLAAERGNPRVAALCDPFHPAVLELIQRVVRAAHAAGKWVSVCGEMAGDPHAVPLLVGLGVDELSMNAPRIPLAKQIIRTLDYSQVQVQAIRVVSAESPEAVREQYKSIS